MPKDYNPLNSIDHLNFIDGLRGMAILGVLAAHSYYFLLESSVVKFKFVFSGGILDAGQRGVQLFFMLSAFTLFNSSFKRFKIDKYPVLDFYIRRFFRIIPYYWIVCFIWILILNPSVKNAAASILFYFGFISKSGIVPGAWTLFAEETFYVFLPLLFLYIQNLKRATVFTVFLFALSVFDPIYSTIFKHLDTGSIFTLPLKQWWCFGLGLMLFFYYQSIKNKVKENSSLTLFLISVLALIFSLKFGYYFQVISLTLLFICCFYPNNFFGKLSRNKFLGQIGVYCYSIYLTHFLILKAFDFFKINALINNMIIDLPFEINVAIMFFVLLFISYILSMVTFKYIERPFILLGKKVVNLINKKQPSTFNIQRQGANNF